MVSKYPAEFLLELLYIAVSYVRVEIIRAHRV